MSSYADMGFPKKDAYYKDPKIRCPLFSESPTSMQRGLERGLGLVGLAWWPLLEAKPFNGVAVQ